jgi:hypothetical protein
MKSLMLRVLLIAPWVLACGPNPHVQGGGGKQGHAGTGGQAGDAGQAGSPSLPCGITHRFQAHAAGELSAKYTVEPQDKTELTCFYFKNPFYGTKTLVTAEVPIVESAGFARHWRLFGARTGVDGRVVQNTCFSPELTDILLSAGTPGAQPIVYPSDVGLSFVEYPLLALQVFYDNRSDSAGPDSTGVGLCTTDEARPNIAGTVMLGTDIGISIPAHVENHLGGTGTCSNPFRGTETQSATIIASLPHMNRLGTGFRTEQFRGGSSLGYVTNVPLGTWDVDRQFRIPHFEPTGKRIEIRRGDTLKTTCYYTNRGDKPVGFGVNPGDEMCYDYITAYPIAQLRRGCLTTVVIRDP